MPRPSWELSNNAAFAGYLKFLDFQAAGYDLHVTFVTATNAIHFSVYTYAVPSAKVGQSTGNYGVAGVGGYALPGALAAWLTPKVGAVPAVIGYTTYYDFLFANINDKARELGWLAPPPVVQQAYVFNPADFPPL